MALGALVALALLVPGGGGAAAKTGGCTIVGTPGEDVLVGGPGADTICGRGGEDRIVGRGAADRLLGGPGEDVLVGGPGGDLLAGGPGGDRLRGGPGSDVLRGGPGENRCFDASVSRVCRELRPRPLPSPSPPAPPSPPPVVELRQPEPDAEAPSLQSLAFSTENVEIASGDWWVDLSLTAWDESGVGSVLISIEGPDGLWREIDLAAGAPGLWEWSERLEVPSATTAGDYRVTAVTLVDEAGNSVSHDLAWLHQYGLDRGFEVYDGPDREAPNLTGISFEPGQTLDTSAGPVTVDVSISATDPGAGVEAVYLRVANPTSKPGRERLYRSLATLDSGTARDGTWLATFELPEGATAGFYPVVELVLEDADHHWDFLTAAMLEDRGFPGGVTQVGDADTTRPTITSFSIEPQVIHTAQGDREIEVEVGVEDDWSGVNAFFDPVSRLYFQLTPPNWPISWGMSGSSPVLVSGTFRDGVWKSTYLLDEDAGVGTWTVRWISATDRAGNTVRLEDGPLEDFEAEGWDLSFENLP